MRSGLAFSGLLHAVALVLLLTLPAIEPMDRRDAPQPLVEFTYFDTTTAIEVAVDEVVSEDALESAELQDPAPEDFVEEPPEALPEEQPEELPEALAEEVAQEEATPEPEPEVLAESEIAPEPETPAIEDAETLVEAAEEPAVEETEAPALAEAAEPVELAPLTEQALAQPEEAAPPRAALAEPDLAEPALAETELAETSLAEAPSAPLEPAVPQEPVATADAAPQPLQPLDQAPAEPLVTTAPPTVEELPTAESPEPTPAEDPSQPLLLAEPVRPAPSLLPPRRPESIEEEVIAAPARQQAQPQQSAALPRDPTQQYQPRWQGRVTGNQLLDNLAVIADEAAQAEANPALWEVVRLLRQQVRECWRLGRSGQSNPDFVVEMEVKLSRSGTVAHAHILDVARMVESPSFADFARNARSAFQRCSPYALPADRYPIWNSFVLRFLARGQGIAGR